jgi:hypothetical protein
MADWTSDGKVHLRKSLWQLTIPVMVLGRKRQHFQTGVLRRVNAVHTGVEKPSKFGSVPPRLARVKSY